MKSKEKFICSLPWEHLSVHPHGHASPCCEVDWSSDIAFAKNKVNGKGDTILVLAWNFFEDIKKNNKTLSDNFINIKSLEKEL